jgi:(p)ppGpp synthase/HD superfamily hydrolase
MAEGVGRRVIDSNLLTAAFALAAEAHRTQARKGGTVPYLTHLLGVAELVWLHDGTDVEAAAALLHDAVEDGGGKKMLTRITDRCNKVVAGIVQGCSDSLVDTTAGAGKEPWLERKERYLAGLGAHDPSTLLVSACDKLHNLRATRVDYEVLGDALWSRFNPESGWRGQLWYYTELLRIYREHGERRVRQVAELMGVELAGLRALLSARGHDPSDLDQPFNRPG